jgi:phospholipid:diacylglycerol acyltransferase
MMRRRKLANDSASETDTPVVEESPAEKSVEKKHEPPQKRKKRSLGLTFAIGGVVGLLLAGLAKNRDMVSLELIQDLKLDSIIDVIPAGILKEASDLSQSEKEAVSYDPFSTGLALKTEGLGVKHPVVMVRAD